MADFTIGINARDGEIGVTIILEDREETFTIEKPRASMTCSASRLRWQEP
jgi:hypothetical protein